MTLRQIPGPEKEWVLECNVCDNHTAASPVRGAVVCNAILDGWQVGYGEYLCPKCLERRGISRNQPRGER
jgi:hypothetical protein